MSSMIVNRLFARLWTMFSISRWYCVRSVSKVNWVCGRLASQITYELDVLHTIPIIPFIGVRISWDILAKNSDFVLLASSAVSRAAVFF